MMLNRLSNSTRAMLSTCLLLFVSYLTMKISVPLLPHLPSVFHVSASLFKFSMSAFFFCYALSQLFWGAISSSQGLYRAMSLGLSTAIAGTVVILCSTHAWLFIVGRCFEGVGMGVCSPLNRAIIGRYCASTDIPKAILYLAILFNLMPFISPSIGVVLASLGSWRLVFWVLGAVVILITLFLRWLMPQDSPHLTATQPLHRVHHRYWAIIRSKPFWRYSIAYVCLIGLMLSTYAVMPFWLVVQLHVPESHYTLYTLALTVSSLLANLSARYALRHVLIDTLLKTALAVFFACFILTGGLIWLSPKPTLITLLLILSQLEGPISKIISLLLIFLTFLILKLALATNSEANTTSCGRIISQLFSLAATITFKHVSFKFFSHKEFPI